MGVGNRVGWFQSRIFGPGQFAFATAQLDFDVVVVVAAGLRFFLCAARVGNDLRACGLASLLFLLLVMSVDVEKEEEEEVTATVAFISGAEAFLGLVYGIWPEGGRAIHGPGKHMTKPQSNSHNPSFY